MLRKILCLVFCLMMMSGVCAESYTADNTAITVDGLRIGFFDANGAYMTPLKINDLTYVPVQSYAENLKLEAEVNGQAVKVNGMTLAMFGEDGAYLPPVDVDGVVYVPALAFAQSAGLDAEKTENGIAVALKPVAVQPTAAPTTVPHPEFVEVKLTDTNFRKYFSYEFAIQNFYSYETELKSSEALQYGGHIQSFQGNCVFSCTAKTAYQFKNLSIKPSASISVSYVNGIYISGPNFRSMTMPQTGVISEKFPFSSTYIAWTDYVDSTSDLRLIGESVSVSGSIMVPWEEGAAIMYSDASSYHNSGQYDSAISIWQELSNAGYKDAAERLQRTIDAKNEKIEKTYQDGVKYLEEGRYDEAINTLNGLDYKDAKDLLQTARDEKNKAAYDAAAALEAEGKYLEAKKVFEAIRSYSDAAERALACGEAYKNQYEPGYQNALTLMNEKKYDEAVAVFETLNGYEDSANKIDECKFNKVFDEAEALENAEKYEDAIPLYESLNLAEDVARCKDAIPQRDYAAAKALFDAQAYDEAQAAFEALGNYKDAQSMAEQCPIEKIYMQAMAAYNAGNYMQAYPLLAQIYNDARVKPLLKLDENLPVAQLGALLQNENIVWFGPAAWYVIDHDNGKTMLFTVESIGERVFRTEQSRPTWQNSDIRKWLNNDYFKKFTADEQKLIMSSNLKNPKYNAAKNTVPAGANTTDKIFLLNWQEAEKLSAKVLESVNGSWWLRTNTNHNAFDRTWPWWDILVCSGVRDGNAAISPYDYCHGKLATRAAMWVKVGYKNLVSGGKGEAVLHLETQLEKGGFFTDVPDQQYNSKTTAAVKAAQEAMGLKKSGSADYAFCYLLDAYVSK